MCVLVLFYTTIMLDKKRIAIFIDGGNFHHLVIKTNDLGIRFQF